PVGGRHHHASVPGSAHRDRLPGERRILLDLDGGVEGVEVDVQDRFRRRPAKRHRPGSAASRSAPDSASSPSAPATTSTAPLTTSDGRTRTRSPSPTMMKATTMADPSWITVKKPVTRPRFSSPARRWIKASDDAKYRENPSPYTIIPTRATA